LNLLSSFSRAFVVACWLTRIAAAEPKTELKTAPATEPAAEPQRSVRPKNGYFSVGTPRWFVSTRSDLGTPYVKPYFSAGYGLPHWIWAGVDVNAIVTTELAQVYTGVRASAPVLDVAFGVRDTWSYEKRFLAPRATYTKSALYDRSRPRSRYWAWELEVVGAVPLPYSAIVGNFVLVRTLDVPRGMVVYDESYRAIVADPMFAVFRVAAVARLLNENALKIGPLLEHVFETGRAGGVFRLGPAASLQLTDHLEAAAAVTLPLKSPDRLGLMLGTYGKACLRYRWATGESKPEWPWSGEFIP
jgi:hypothetical protein